VLHRHFADFDAFLAELALDRVAMIGRQAADLRAAAGTGSVAANLAAALPELFSPAVLALVRPLIARDELRTRLRAATGARLPLLSESTAMVSGYLAAERDLGRIAADADVPTLAPMVMASVHLLFTDADGTPEGDAVARVVSAALASAALTRQPGELLTISLTVHRARKRSGGTEPQGRPGVIDGDLADRLDAPLGEQRGEDVPVEVGAELARLRVGDPRELVAAGRLDGGRGDRVELRLVPGERDDGVGRPGVGGRVRVRRHDGGHVTVRRERGDQLARLDLKLGGHVHAVIMGRRRVVTRRGAQV
jgi:hypothetical protein